jgi:hypothetical protein
MPAQATTYTFNSPLLPSLNKDNVLTAIFGEPGASSPGPAQPAAAGAAPAEEEEEPSSQREKKGQAGARENRLRWSLLIAFKLGAMSG